MRIGQWEEGVGAGSCMKASAYRAEFPTMHILTVITLNDG